MGRILVVTTLFAALAFSANAQTLPSISVDNAWSRATMPSARTAAIYVTITDHDGPDRLIGVSTPVAGKAEVHETIHDGDIMKMRPSDGVAIAPGATISFAPGGSHIMLTELKQPLAGGQTFPLSLHFEKAGTVEGTVTVKAMGAAMDRGGAGHDMQPMNMPGMSKP
jgi:copper(I)-binding protein